MKKAMSYGTIIVFTRKTLGFRRGQVGKILRSVKDQNTNKTWYLVQPIGAGFTAWVHRNNNMRILDRVPTTRTAPEPTRESYKVGDRVKVVNAQPLAIQPAYTNGIVGRVCEIYGPGNVINVDFGRNPLRNVVLAIEEVAPAKAPVPRVLTVNLPGRRRVQATRTEDGSVLIKFERPEGDAQIETRLQLSPEAAAATIKVISGALE